MPTWPVTLSAPSVPCGWLRSRKNLSAFSMFCILFQHKTKKHAICDALVYMSMLIYD